MLLFPKYFNPPFKLYVKLSQLENAEEPILVTPSGIETLVKLSQPQNAQSPMLVTLSGIEILVKLSQPQNAELPMFVTLSGISSSFTSLLFKYIGQIIGGTGLVNAFSATGLLIVVSVAIEFDKSLEAQMLMKNYKGFLK